MDHFHYLDRHLHAEQSPLREIATRFGTPCYVYSRATVERHWRAFDDAFSDYPHRICYAVKANSNLAILNLLAQIGSGFDIVSGGELHRVLAAGGDPSKIVFSGVCKQPWEIRAAVDAGISSFNIESENELHLISEIAGERGQVAAISVRLNPDVDAQTHPYISTGLRDNKFGLNPTRALVVYKQARTDPNIRIAGVACHIGSQLIDLAPYRDALQQALAFVEKLEAINIEINHIDFGGGLGVRYHDETPPTPAEYAAVIIQQLKTHPKQLSVTIEPGRAIVGNAGILLTCVNDLKRGDACSFCVVDAGMNDFLRPALYQAWQEIIEVEQRCDIESAEYDVVGPVCESGDFLGKARNLKVRAGDLLAVRTAGAYSAVMSSNYNSRPRPAEVMVDGDKMHLVRKRESIEELYRDEFILPE